MGVNIADNKKEIELFLGKECVWCGDLMVKDVSVALVEDNDLLL